LDEALTILTQVGSALQYAHERHIIHRDLKPENILFNAKEDALLADFEIAVVLLSSETLWGDPVETLAYMAPEHIQGAMSKRGDQYALAVIAYELMTGRRPFLGPNSHVLIQQHLSQDPLPPRRLQPHIPSFTEQAILRAMAKQPEDRYRDISTFLAALCSSSSDQICSEDEGPKGERVSRIVFHRGSPRHDQFNFPRPSHLSKKEEQHVLPVRRIVRRRTRELMHPDKIIEPDHNHMGVPARPRHQRPLHSPIAARPVQPDEPFEIHPARQARQAYPANSVQQVLHQRRRNILWLLFWLIIVLGIFLAGGEILLGHIDQTFVMIGLIFVTGLGCLFYGGIAARK
jgi:serine/threonine protein kinase